MKNKITLLIREKENLSLPQYAKKNKLDIKALRRVIYKKDIIEINNDNTIIYKKTIPCRVKESEEYKARKALVKDNYLHEDSLSFDETINYKDKLQERRKIISRLRTHYNLSIKTFYEENEKYFNLHNISLSYLYVFMSGIGTGIKENTKAYFIKNKLKSYSLLEAPTVP